MVRFADETSLAFLKKKKPPPTRAAIFRGTLAPGAPLFFFFVIPAILFQLGAIYITKWIENNNPQFSPDSLFFDSATFLTSIVVALLVGESITMYANARGNWDTTLTNLTHIGIYTASTIDTSVLATLSGEKRTEAIRTIVDFRDVLGAFPYAIKHYFRDSNALDVDLLPMSERMKRYVKDVTLTRTATGKPVGKFLDYLTLAMNGKYTDLIESGVISSNDGGLALKQFANSLGDIETARTFRVLPILRSVIWTTVFVFFSISGVYMYATYRWHSLWINPLIIYLFGGLLISSEFARNPFAKSNPMFPIYVTIDYRDDADNVAAVVFSSFEDKVFNAIDLNADDERAMREADDVGGLLSFVRFRGEPRWQI